MTDLNDMIAFTDYILVATEIKREGMIIYAVVKVYNDNTTKILRTALDKRFIITMLQEEVYKATQEGKREALLDQVNVKTLDLGLDFDVELEIED